MLWILALPFVAAWSAVHRLTHKHLALDKAEVGYIHACSARGLPKARAHVFFRPDFEGARWYPVPEDVKIYQILECANAFEAMAIVRRQAAES